MALLDGKPVVSFQVFRSRGASEISVAEDVRAAIARLQAERPNVRVTEVCNLVKPVSGAYTASMHALYEGAILAVLVVWLFLRDWRATFVSAVALPLSIIPTFAAMQVLGFTLNGVTLPALTLVVGILVDDAIVEVENIVRHLRNGKPPFEAALEAAQEIGLAVIATSLILMGIVTKNSILLVEYAIVAQRDHGMSRTEALIDACHKRARPIVMTTVAMTAGMVPMALGLEGDAGFRAPMAVAVIGGLLTSTLLSLLVVPVVFEKVDDLKAWVLRWLPGIRPRRGGTQPSPPQV